MKTFTEISGNKINAYEANEFEQAYDAMCSNKSGHSAFINWDAITEFIDWTFKAHAVVVCGGIFAHDGGENVAQCLYLA